MKIKIPNKYLADHDWNGKNKDFSFYPSDIIEIIGHRGNKTEIKYMVATDGIDKRKVKIIIESVFLDLKLTDTIAVLYRLIKEAIREDAPPCFK